MDTEPDDGLRVLRSHLFEGRYEEAIREIETLEPKMRSRGDIQNVKAVCLLHLSKPHEALKVLDETIAANPGDEAARHNRLEALFGVCEARIEAANKRFLAGDSGGALACYDLVSQAHLEELRVPRPELLYTYYNNRGAVYMKMNRFAQALADFESAVQMRSKQSDAQHNRGVALKAMKRFEDALGAFDACLEIEPSNYSALCGKSEVLASLDRFEDAIEVASLAIDATDSPDSYRGLLGRGFARLKYGDYGGAVRDLEKAESRGCKSSEFIMMYELALALYGDELSEIGEYELAIDHYERALAMGSSDQPSVDVLFNLTLAKLYSGDKSDEPANGFRHVLSLRPSHAQAAAVLGQHLLELSYPNSPEAHEACMWLQRAIEMRPNEANLRYTYGLALMKVGNMKGAGDSFRKVLEINPDHQMAMDGLSRVEGFSAGFAIAAAVARRSSAKVDKGGYEPGSPRAAKAKTPVGSKTSEASNILMERTKAQDGMLPKQSSMSAEDYLANGNYSVSPRAEVPFLKEQLRRRDEYIEVLRKKVEKLEAELAQYKGDSSAYSGMREGVRASQSASMESRDGAIIIEPGPESEHPKVSVIAGASPTASSVGSQVSLQRSFGPINEKVGPYYQDGNMGVTTDAPAGPQKRRVVNITASRLERSRSGRLPSVSVNELDALNNRSSEDALIDMRFSYSELKAPGPFPPGINIQERERYLKDKDFETVFKMSRSEFNSLSKWRRTAMKKELALW